jgi:hypothetical protein
MTRVAQNQATVAIRAGSLSRDAVALLIDKLD